MGEADRNQVKARNDGAKTSVAVAANSNAEKTKLIVSLSRYLLKPKPNTIWDYLVPLSLVGLQFFVLNYALTHYEVDEPFKEVQVVEKSIWAIDGLSAEISFGIFMILSIFFLTRVQRIVVFPFLIFFVVALFTILKGGTIEEALGLAFLSIVFQSFYLISTISLLIKFGNNSSVKINKKSSPARSAIAFGVYGLGFQMLPLILAPLALFGGQAGVRSKFPPILEQLFNLLESLRTSAILYFLFYPVLFALIGYSIEKYKQSKSRGGK